MTWNEMVEIIDEHNHQNNVQNQYGDKHHFKCYVVFSNNTKCWRRHDFSLESRTYEFRSDEKFFVPRMIGSSIFASNLDGTDKYIRLDNYLHEWQIERCYIKINGKVVY